MTSKEYPFPCTSCGFCCAANPCPIAFDRVAGAVEGKPCPALDMRPGRETSICALLTAMLKMVPDHENRILHTFGVGAGCCISARCILPTDPNPIDFSSLSPVAKRVMARQLYESLTNKTMTSKL